jgi:hypothetical protein
MHLDERLEAMPRYYARAQELARAFRDIEGLIVNPQPPHVNLMHLHVQASTHAATEARNRTAREERTWLLGGIQASDVPGWCTSEVYVGENALAWPAEEAGASMRRFVRSARELTGVAESTGA